MSRLEFPKWRKVPQFLPQQGVQLETLPVTIQHPQQRRSTSLLRASRPSASVRPAISTVSGSQNPRAHRRPSHRAAAAAARAVRQWRAAAERRRRALRCAISQAAARAPPRARDQARAAACRRRPRCDGQVLHALRKLKQRVAMFFGGFLAEVDSENRFRLAPREALHFQRISPRKPRQRTPERRAEQRDRRSVLRERCYRSGRFELLGATLD